MKTPTYTIVMMFLAITAAHAQQAQTHSSTNSPQAATPVPGIDNAVMARGARASKLIGSKVYQGDISIGEIEDVIVDLEHSNLVAVILSVGGFLGIGEKLVAVPVNQIKAGAEAKFTTDLTKEQMTNAPAFNFGSLR